MGNVFYIFYILLNTLILFGEMGILRSEKSLKLGVLALPLLTKRRASGRIEVSVEACGVPLPLLSVPQCVDELAVRSRVDSISRSANLGEKMVSSEGESFTKQATCPSAKSLLDYRLHRLAVEMDKLVKWHLEDCDFCWAEIQMLGHHGAQAKVEAKPPTIPVNLRILAEALLRSKSLPAKKTQSAY